MNGQQKLTPSDAVAVFFAGRHSLAPDILRSLQDMWVCASAARYGKPYETWQLGDPDAYRTHDVAACDAENDQPARPWDEEGLL